MKICKYCKEEIVETAMKCPKCQSFQSKYRNPNFLMGVVFPFAILIPLFWSMFHVNNRNKKEEFVDYRDKIVLKELSRDTIHEKSYKLLNLIVEIDNKTDITWEQAQYEVEFYSDDGKLVNIEKNKDYQIFINPNSKVKSSIKVRLHSKYEKAKIVAKLTNVEHNLY